jgi:small subunit ribosomal protein S3
MGQKISVNLFRANKRLSNVTNGSGTPNQLQKSVWYANKTNYSKLLIHDLEIRRYLKKQLAFAGLVQIVIRRYFRKVEIVLFVTKPGIVIGRSGASINELKDSLIKNFLLPKDIKIEILEFKDPFQSSAVVAFEIAEGLKRNVPFRKLAKTYIEKIRYSAIQGAKIEIGGRLNGAEIARTEKFSFGSVPRHTIDSNIDYTYEPSLTKTGMIGVKVWIYKGDKLKNYTY